MYEPDTTIRLTDDQVIMVQENMGLVWFVVNEMFVMGEDDREDAFAAGVCGLAKAVRTYRPDRGFRFSTHAVPWIRGAIQRDPVVGSTRRACKGHHSRFRAVSLDAATWRDSWGGDGVYLQTYDVSSRAADELEELIDNLFGEHILDTVLGVCEGEREVAIIWDRFVAGLTYAEIGENWNLTGGRVQQLVNRIMRRVRVSGAWRSLTVEGEIPV